MKQCGIIVAAFIVLCAFAGCDGDNTSSLNPPTGLAVYEGDSAEGTPVGSLVLIEVDDEQKFTASATGADSYTWTIEDDDDEFVEFKDDISTGSTVTIIGTDEGTATINVTASNADGSAGPLSFQVKFGPIPPTGLGVMSDTSEVTADSTITIILGDEEEFTASAISADSYTWTIEDGGDEFVSFEDEDTTEGTFTIKGIRKGTATINVIATGVTGGTTEPFSFQVEVDPVIFFEWKSDINTAVEMTPGYNGTVFSVPAYPDMYVRASSAGNKIEVNNRGFKLGGDLGTSTALLILGGGNSTVEHSPGNPNPAGAPTTADGPHIPGQLDLSQGTFKLTIEYEEPIVATNRVLLRVQINNNTGTNASTVLGSSPSASIRTYNTVKGTGGLEEGIQNIDGTSNRGLSVDEVGPGKIGITFTPSVRFNSHTSLANAFIALFNQGGTSGSTPSGPTWITITGIRLEKISL